MCLESVSESYEKQSARHGLKICYVSVYIAAERKNMTG